MVKLIKEFQNQPDGVKYVPILYDIVVVDRVSTANPLAEGKDQELVSIFLVMEYFPTDLKKLIETDLRYQPPKTLLKIMFNALNALNFIHQCNVVHRDIKPANILLTHDF